MYLLGGSSIIYFSVDCFIHISQTNDLMSVEPCPFRQKSRYVTVMSLDLLNYDAQPRSKTL